MSVTCKTKLPKKFIYVQQQFIKTRCPVDLIEVQLFVAKTSKLNGITLLPSISIPYFQKQRLN